MKTKIAIVLCALAFSPTVAMATCQDRAQTTMSCGDGQVFDANTKACVPVSG